VLALGDGALSASTGEAGGVFVPHDFDLVSLAMSRLTCEEEHALLDALPFEEEFEWLHLLYRCAFSSGSHTNRGVVRY
jgi:hypothetical protein